MFTFLSLITSIKDYVEVVHKLIETDSNLAVHSYYDFGSVFTFIILTGKDCLQNFLTFQWFQNFWSIPTIVPDVASSLLSEISVFDGYFKNTQTFLESPFSYGNQNFFISCLEKFTIGFLNSLFLCFPTSIAHVITLRRFVMQGLEAGFISGLGTIVGNIVWIGSILFGFRFFVIPWLSLDLFRYFLGFLLIVKYMWDTSRERRMVLEDFSKYKIFFLTFLLSFTEQTTLYPFISNLSFGSDSTLLESFPTQNFSQFTFVHCSYLLGLLLGSLSLLQFTCWFWENPAFQIYMWFLSSYRNADQITKNNSPSGRSSALQKSGGLGGPKFVNFIFLYLTMICAIANFSYFGLDYTLTNPLGFVHEDRLLEQKAFFETAFLNSKASDRNTRRNRGRHGRRERWKRRIRKYRTFDASLYDQGTYDLFTIEDLNYGFDRFWLRRKIRNHRVRFRFFPGPWMRNFKKQLSRPRLESFLGPRVEFFRILFEQAYHPEFHEFSSPGGEQRTKKNILKTNSNNFSLNEFFQKKTETNQILSKENQNSPFFDIKATGQNLISWNIQGNKKERILKERSAFRKFTRKVQTRLKKAKIEAEIQNPQNVQFSYRGVNENSKNIYKPISSKTWKTFAGIEKRNDNSLRYVDKNFSTSFTNSSLFKKSEDNFYFQRFYKKLFTGGADKNFSEKAKTHFSKKERFLQRYKNFLMNSNSSFSSIGDQKGNEKMLSSQETKTILFSSGEFPLGVHSNFQGENNFDKVSPKVANSSSLFGQSFGQGSRKVETQMQTSGDESFDPNESLYRPMTLLHPLQFYFQKEQALKRKFQFYGVKQFRNYGVENNAPYFRVLMKRFFYHYKPSLRWERTLRVASTRRARRKSSRIPKKFNIEKNTQIFAQSSQNNKGENINFSFSGVKNLNTDITDPTHFYSLVDKRASRYRFQIYKDVLQHWYYSPLNRLLLKLDVDAFIRRQPNSYFLTKNDEKFLHLKRQLLSEYYETLRWYTSMENYSTMKNQIGGTKSLSSRAYNQQFAGTLKKIRHLFNISPSFRENTVLKFDQPLYNEYTTSSFGRLQNGSGASLRVAGEDNSNGNAFADSILHEELFSSTQAENFLSPECPRYGCPPPVTNTSSSTQQKTISGAINFAPSLNPENLVNQSTTILREYLATAAPVRQQYIENLLKEKNYWELSRFLFRGQKIRGTRPVTNETDFLNQEKDLLLTNNAENQTRPQIGDPRTSPFDPYALKDEMWISLLKKCQKKLYDQEALKNYVSLKKEKYEVQKQRHEKYLKNRFSRIKEAVFQNSEVLMNKKTQNVFSPPFDPLAKRRSGDKKIQSPGGLQSRESQKNEIQNFENFSGYPSSLKKAMKESILWENNSLSNSSFQTVEKIFGAHEFSTYGKKLFLEKTNIRKNQLPMYSLLQKDKENNRKNFITGPTNNAKTKSVMFTKNLHFVVKKQAIQILKAEKEVLHLRGEKFGNSQKKSKILNIPNIFESVFRKTKQTVLGLRNKAIGFQNDFFVKKSDENLKKSFSLFTPVKRFLNGIFNWRKNDDSKFDRLVEQNKNIDFWKKRENVLAKRKKLRKTLKRLRNQKAQTEKIVFENSDFFTPLSEHKNSKNENRFKTEKNLNDFLFANSARSWQNYLTQKGTNFAPQEEQKSFHFLGIRSFGSKIADRITEKKFQRKRTRLRRYSSFKGRGPIKKRTLREKLKRQFKSLKKYGKNQNALFPQRGEKQKERENKKAELIQFITQRNSAPTGEFTKRDEKQRRTRQMKQRAWKKKKQNFAQKRRKLKKRRRSTVSKIRVYNKKIYRILSRKEIQTWWWKTFYPHFQKRTEKTWQLEKNQQIQKQLFELSEKEIFERDQKNKGNIIFRPTKSLQTEMASNSTETALSQNLSKIDSLQIGNKDFKPFAIPETLRIREKLVQKNILRFDPSGSSNNLNGENKYTSVPDSVSQKSFENKEEDGDTQIFEKVNNFVFGFQNSADQKTQSLPPGHPSAQGQGHLHPPGGSHLQRKGGRHSRSREGGPNSPFLIATNPLPFYAGWDNDLRKFVLTNRLLARKDCFSRETSALIRQGSAAYSGENAFGVDKEKSFVSNEENFEFLQSPLQGMNAATTLYWQIPFTTYDPDQFFALGMDGFSPIGWRNFSFKHSKQTTKPILVKNFYSFGSNSGEEKLNKKNSNKLSLDLRFKISQQTVSPNNRFTKTKQEIEKNFEYRRILKKQKRLKKHPRPPVWFPSGSLSQQVLPVHYIYVFYKRSRLPRDRYIRRRLRTTFLNNQNSRQDTSFADRTKMIDFTLRKRTKPRRKYHRKRFGDFSEKNQFFAQRRKFRNFFDDPETSRPSSKLFLREAKTSSTGVRSGEKQEKRVLRSKQRRKIQDSKQPNENIRVRQLRRRVQRQVYRPVWRSRPRAGGFVWPGDYLRFESVKASALKSTSSEATLLNKNETPFESENAQSSTRKIRKKNRRTLQEWQIQPKRYFFEKHNLKVLKKRIEKSMNLHI
jgi:hypothetical protein